MFPVSQNLSDVNRFLTSKLIPHRFTEHGNDQILWIAVKEHHLILDTFFAQKPDATVGFWVDEGMTSQVDEHSQAFKYVSLVAVCRLPVSLITILLGLAGMLAISTLSNGILEKCCFFRPSQDMYSLSQSWRLLIPTFLHFGWLHWLSNCVWLWVLGRLLEPFLGSIRFTIVLVLMAIIANITQFLMVGSIYFGGLSGVVYGCFGFLAVAHILNVDITLRLPFAMYLFMAVCLILGFLGAGTFFLSVQLANWAHLGGLISGLVLAILYFYSHIIRLCQNNN